MASNFADGRQEKVFFDKITARITNVCKGLDMRYIEPIEIAQKVVSGIYPGVTTVELDNLAAETAAAMTTKHSDYALLAAKIAVSSLHKQTLSSFSQTMEKMHAFVNKATNQPYKMISDSAMEAVRENAQQLDAAIDYERDFCYNYFGFKTLERSYLLKIDGKIVERPQHMLMRVAIGIHGMDATAVIETYNLMSLRYFTHASPTLFNAATQRPQLSSCFLVTMSDDSIEGIYDTLKTTALISKSAGGIGLNIHNIRAKGSLISGTNGTSNGIVPMLRVFNNTARYVDQGGNKRPGAFAIYLEPWHSDIFDFLDLKKNTGKDENRARDLFYGLWIPDLFMRRVEANQEWALFCPAEAKDLQNCYGAEFDALYVAYEKAGIARKTIKAQSLWTAIVDSQIETGTPYMLYKDSCNAKSNQKNLGTIKCSNLCTEIIQYSSPEEVAVCNLASISLPAYVSTDGSAFDFATLHAVSKVVAKNLNKIIDINFYPIPQAEKSNLRHRPIGIGVQGLADVFMKMKFPFESESAKKLNIEIFETIYHAALEASCELAAVEGVYETFQGSPASQGILQYDFWNVVPTCRWDWKDLKTKIAVSGLRNSLLCAPMPTASTSQILGNNECFEPYTSNIYSRRVLAGEFQIVNPFLMKDLTELGLWNASMKNAIIANNGSIQAIPEISNSLKELYKTVWEISQKSIIDMAADRNAFIDQSHSLNIHIAEPSYSKITSMHFYGWKKGLKTGMYYLRTRPAADAIKFTVDQASLKRSSEVPEKTVLSPSSSSCSLAEGCISCSG